MIRRLFTAVLRHRWAVLGLTMLGTAGGYMATRMVVPQYYGQATVWIESGRREGGADRGPIRSEQLLASFGWVDLLKSDVVLDSVVHTRRLYLSVGPGADSALFADFALAPRFAPGQYTLAVKPDGTYQLRNGSSNGDLCTPPNERRHRL